MPDPITALVVVALVALVEATPAIRVPLGLLLAIALLAVDAELLPIALLGAVGVMLARLALALMARFGATRLGASSPAAAARRDALRRQLSSSPAYARMTFTFAALPGVPATFMFPLLGAMRAPLGPALAGTIVGRVPVLALTTWFFTWLGRAGTTSDEDAALLLGVMAILLLLLRTLNRVDWQHRSQGGGWRMRQDEPFLRMFTFGTTSGQGTGSDEHAPPDGEDVVEGELLGEEIDGQDDDPPAELPSSRE